MSDQAQTNNETTTEQKKSGLRVDYVRIALGVTTVVALGALWYTVYQKNVAERKDRLFKAKQADVLGQLRSPPGGRVQIRHTKSTNPDAV